MAVPTASSPQPASGEHRDPVCGMSVQEKGAQRVVFEGRTYHFCSTHCRRTFDKDPRKYTSPA